MIRLHSECIRCLTGKYLSNPPAHLSEEQKIEYFQTILSIMGQADPRHAAPVAMQDIERILFENSESGRIIPKSNGISTLFC